MGRNYWHIILPTIAALTAGLLAGWHFATVRSKSGERVTSTSTSVIDSQSPSRAVGGSKPNAQESQLPSRGNESGAGDSKKSGFLIVPDSEPIRWDLPEHLRKLMSDEDRSKLEKALSNDQARIAELDYAGKLQRGEPIPEAVTSFKDMLTQWRDKFEPLDRSMQGGFDFAVAEIGNTVLTNAEFEGAMAVGRNPSGKQRSLVRLFNDNELGLIFLEETDLVASQTLITAPQSTINESINGSPATYATYRDPMSGNTRADLRWVHGSKMYKLSSEKIDASSKDRMIGIATRL